MREHTDIENAWSRACRERMGNVREDEVVGAVPAGFCGEIVARGAGSYSLVFCGRPLEDNGTCAECDA